MVRFMRAEPAHPYDHHGPRPVAAPLLGTGTPQPSIPSLIGYRRITRSWTGRCPVAGGITGPQAAPPPPVVTAYHRPVMQARRRPAARALWRGSPAPAAAPPPLGPFLTGVIVIHNPGGTETTWNITGTPAS
jgi:hypothetical protein